VSSGFKASEKILGGNGGGGGGGGGFKAMNEVDAERDAAA
jgi:hypothetical protein